MPPLRAPAAGPRRREASASIPSGRALPFVAPVAGDNSISAIERLGLTVSGIAEANSSVTVTLGTASRTATADASGAWTTTPFGTLEPPPGPAFVTLSAVATDQAGNRGAILTRPIRIEELPFAIAPQGAENLAFADNHFDTLGPADPLRAAGIDPAIGLDDTRYLA